MKPLLNNLNTELSNPNTVEIYKQSTEDILSLINDEDQKVTAIVKEQIPKITKVVNAVVKALESDGRIFYIGAGTSGRLGILDAAEIPPTFGTELGLFQGIIAGGNDAMFQAKEGSEDSVTDAVNDLSDYGFNKNDFLIGIAASGRTPYVIGGLKYAKDLGAQTASICNVEQGKISEISNYPIEVVTGPEVVTGSTRMKAGTAQKLVLNMISTTAMIKMGKVYQNYMVDLKPSNIKLENRAITMIQNLLNVKRQEAELLYKESNKHVKSALIMGMFSCSLAEATKMLDLHKGRMHLLLEAENI